MRTANTRAWVMPLVELLVDLLFFASKSACGPLSQALFGPASSLRSFLPLGVCYTFFMPPYLCVN